MNSMHGFWMAMARLANVHWIKSSWWPFWDCGMPFEYTYAPLVPGLTAALAKVSATSIALAYHRVAGLAYCLAPVTLFILLWRVTRRVGMSLFAAMAYSLTAPATLLVPDGQFHLSSFWSARRLFLAVVWDETPHLLAVGFLPLLVLFLARSYQTRKHVWYWAAGMAMALMVLASAFGAVLVVTAATCLLFTVERDRWVSNLRTTCAIGILAYLAISPYVPPSLFLLIRSNAQARADSAWTISSFTALAVLVLVWIVALPLVRRASGWYFQLFLLFAITVSTIAMQAAYGGRRFLPQPERYRIEMEMALVVAAVLGAQAVWKKLPPRIQVGIMLVLVSIAVEQISAVRKFAKGILAPSDIRQTIEFRAAQWLDRNIPGRRVMMGGSLGGGWLNTFIDSPQFSGSSFPTAPNQVQQSALLTILWGLQSNPHDGRIAVTWLQAYGVSAVGVPGPNSPEFWKPFAGPQMFEGILPVLWREKDTTIYEIPQRSASLAHVLPERAIVREPPRNGFDLRKVEGYVRELQDASHPLADMRWDGYNHAFMNTNMGANDRISVQVTYHPGWRAKANRHKVSIEKDGLGLMALDPACNGACEIELTYDGGLEMQLLRLASPLELALLIAWSAGRWHKKRSAGRFTVLSP